ncbi:MAG TPA: hypothetical protein VFX51_16850 [Solirubrobacteraceae bacterium]|nr:hypothetical protein [Solirubrobacteraceae bacterium]
MAALCKIYSAEVVARQAVETLTAAGVPERDIRLLTGSHVHDIRSESAGSFYGRVDPSAPVGKFAGPPRPRWVGGGTFAGDARRQRQGSFADATGDRTVRRLLRRYSVSGSRAEDVIEALHAGRAVVVAEVSEIPPSEAAMRLESVA